MTLAEQQVYDVLWFAMFLLCTIGVPTGIWLLDQKARG